MTVARPAQATEGPGIAGAFDVVGSGPAGSAPIRAAREGSARQIVWLAMPSSRAVQD